MRASPHTYTPAPFRNAPAPSILLCPLLPMQLQLCACPLRTHNDVSLRRRYRCYELAVLKVRAESFTHSLRAVSLNFGKFNFLLWFVVLKRRFFFGFYLRNFMTWYVVKFRRQLWVFGETLVCWKLSGLKKNMTVGENDWNRFCKYKVRIKILKNKKIIEIF